jgi:hypothetical protein
MWQTSRSPSFDQGTIERKTIIHVNVKSVSSVNTELRMECSTRSLRHPNLGFRSQDSLSLHRCLLHQRANIHQLPHKLGKEDTARYVNRDSRKKHSSKTVQELRKMKDKNGNKLVGQTYLGSPLCNKGKRVRVCPNCWKSYTHDL